MKIEEEKLFYVVIDWVSLDTRLATGFIVEEFTIRLRRGDKKNNTTENVDIIPWDVLINIRDNCCH